MAYGNTSYVDKAATNIDKWISDNGLDLLLANNAFLAVLMGRSKKPGAPQTFMKLDAGGIELAIPVFGKKDSNVQGVTRSGQASLTFSPALPTNGATLARYNYAHYTDMVYDSQRDRDLLDPNKPQSMVNYVEIITNRCLSTFHNLVETDLWAGTTDSESKILSVNFGISAANNVGGIDQSDSTNNAWWQAQVDSAGGAFSVSKVTNLMDAASFYQSRDIKLREGIDAIFTDPDTYARLQLDFLASQRQGVDGDENSLGANTFRFKNALVVRDPAISSGNMYGVNSSTWVFAYVTENPVPRTGWVPTSGNSTMWERGYNWIVSLGLRAPNRNFAYTGYSV